MVSWHNKAAKNKPNSLQIINVKAEVDVYFQSITSLLSCQTLQFWFLYFHYTKWIRNSKEWDILQANHKPVQLDSSSKALVHVNTSVLRSCIALNCWHTSFRWTDIPSSLLGSVYLTTKYFSVWLKLQHFSKEENIWRKWGGHISPCTLASVQNFADTNIRWMFGGGRWGPWPDKHVYSCSYNSCSYNSCEFLEGNNWYLPLYADC